jgi:archaellum component FlaC
MRKNLFLLILAALLSYPIIHCYAQNDLSNSASLSFARNFPAVDAARSLGVSGISINVTVGSRLKYRSSVILFTECSSKYAEGGSSTSVESTVSNAVSSFELSVEANTSIDYGIGTMDVPTYTLLLEYAVLETMGSSQSIVMGEYLLFSGRLPFFGVQVSIFMRPVVAYTPTLSGNAVTTGSASASPSSLHWNQESVNYQVEFSQSEPVVLFLSSPTSILDNFNLVLELYAIINTETVYALPMDVVGSGDYSLRSPSVTLLSFEPDYYALYSELQESYATLASSMQHTEESLSNLTSEMELLKEDIRSLALQLQNLTQRLEYLETLQLQNLTQRVEHLEKENPLLANFTALKDQVQTLSASWDNLTGSVDRLTDKVDAVSQRLDESERSFILAVAVPMSLAGFFLGAISLWKSFKNG